MREVITYYDALQHCTTVVEALDKAVAMDCPYTGRGEEMSPTNMVEAALGGCILMSAGTLAMRNDIDLTGTSVWVAISNAPEPPNRFDKIDINVSFPAAYSRTDRIKLERAADACPIKHSFNSEVEINVSFNYPE